MKICRYVNVFLMILFFSVSILIMSMLLPQKFIDYNLKESIYVFTNEKSYPYIGDYEETSKLDNFTDSLILEGAGAMNNWKTILGNPIYVRGMPRVLQEANLFLKRDFPELREDLKRLLRINLSASFDPVAIFPKFVENIASMQPTGYYVRYWQGFRAPVRFLLCFLNYQQIRKFLAYLIFSLLVGAILLIEKYTDTRTALLFAMSFIFIKPWVICNSLHYSCDVLLALIAVFFIPSVLRRKKELEFFLALGMFTMFFDFWSYALIVLGYPLIFSLLLTTKDKSRIKWTFKQISSWLSGYILMWLSKLTLATVFTPINGFTNGFTSFAQRTGIIKRGDLIEYYGIAGAFQALMETVFPDVLSVMFLFLFLVLIVVMVYSVNKQHSSVSIKALKTYVSLLLPILLMLIWYAIAAQPTKIHVYTQYRNIAMAIWALSMYISLAFKPLPTNKILQVGV